MAILHDNPERRRAAWLYALALAINAALAWYWIAVTGIGPTGDEGHYLMISRSLAEDHDFEVRGDYANPQRVLRTFGGPVDNSHTWKRPDGWYSLHYPGLSAIVALPYEAFGIAGARVTMCFIAAALIVLVFQILNRYLQDRAWACTLACFFYFGLLYLAGSNQIYPDLPAGIAILAATDVCMRYFRKIQVGRGAFMTAVLPLAVLPWLHMKYLVPVTLLSATLAWHLYRGPSRSFRRIIAGGAVVGFSVLGLFAYNVHCFGVMSGPLEHFSISKMAPAIMVYAGLHLDQAQGLFLQQPLYLLGVLGLAALWRENRWTLLWLLLLYHTILLPNATHPNLYGGYSFVGRYLWSCSLLWIYPAAAFLAFLRALAPTVFAPLLAVPLSIRPCSRTSGFLIPTFCSPRRSEKGLARNTLFGGNLPYALPSFYDPQLYASEAVNVLAAAGVLVLALGGGLLLQKRYAAVQILGTFYLAALALFSPGVPSREYARDREMVRAQAGLATEVKRFEAEGLKVHEPSPSKIVKDPDASGGLARQIAADPNLRGREDFFFYGPYAKMAAGLYEADFVLRTDAAASKEKIAVLDVNSIAAGVLGTLDVAGTDFRRAGEYQTFKVKFKLSRPVTDLEFRCRHYYLAALTADRVDVVKLSDEP